MVYGNNTQSLSYYRPQYAPQPRYGIFPGEGSGIPLHPRDSYGDRGLGWNFQDVNTGSHWGHWQRHSDRGYGLDMNRNGRFDRGRDGVLVFDLNGDGRYDKRDVRNTNDMMKSVTGNWDFNGDGYVSRSEARRGNQLRWRYQSMDRNRDGRLDKWEMSQAGGRVWVDKSRGGGVGRNELHSVWNVPNSNGWGPSQRLDFVDPFSRINGNSSSWSHPGFGPHYGGGQAWAGGTPGFYYQY